MAKKRFDIKNNLLGGAFLTRSQMAGQWVFILYIFGLIFLYITLNLAVINTQKIYNDEEAIAFLGCPAEPVLIAE